MSPCLSRGSALAGGLQRVALKLPSATRHDRRLAGRRPGRLRPSLRRPRHDGYNQDMTDLPSRLKPKRRWLQFSLRSFFLLVTAFALWFGWAMQQAREQRQAVAEIERFGGAGAVFYSYQFDGDNQRIIEAAPPGPAWLRDIVGIDFMADIVGVELRMTSVTDLAPLAELPKLQWLSLEDTSVTDLTPLAGLDNLRELWVEYTPVSDLTPLAGLPNLQELHLDYTPVRDVTPLAESENVRILTLRGTKVADVSPVARMNNLHTLDLSRTPASDLTPLAASKNLQRLGLLYSPASEEHVTTLRQAMPRCEVDWCPADVNGTE